MSDVFISYAREDEDVAKWLARDLAAADLSVWWDRIIPVGMTWDEVIGRELTQARCVVVVWSRFSVDSKWVRAEAHTADNRGVLVPVTIGNTLPPFPFNLVQSLDLTGWRGETDDPRFERLVGTVRRFVAGLPPEQDSPPLPVPPPVVGRHRSKARRVMLATAVAIVAIAFSLGAWSLPGRERPSESAALPMVKAGPVPQEAPDEPEAPVPPPADPAATGSMVTPAASGTSGRNIPNRSGEARSPEKSPGGSSGGRETITPAPRERVPTAGEIIDEVLEGYRLARERQDIEGLRKVWPSVPANDYLKSWKNQVSENVSLTCDPADVSGDTARVTCVEHLKLRFSTGQSDARTTSTTFTIGRRSDQRWVIQGRAAKLDR